MKPWTVIRRSLLFFHRTNLAVLLGTAVCTAVLVGALVVGDSVPHSLRRIAETRLGSSEYAVVSRTRSFRAGLAQDLSSRLGVSAAPVLNVSGLAVRPEGDLRVGGVEVLGVDSRFWAMGFSTPAIDPAYQLKPGQAIVNQRLARRLGIQVGEQIVVRLERPELIPAEMPFALEREDTIAFRLTVTAIAAQEQFGTFSLSPHQVSPFNLFLSLDWLSRILDLDEAAPGGPRANILLVPRGAGADAQSVAAALRSTWRLTDLSLEVESVPGSDTVELRSDRVFLEQPLSRSALAAGDGAVGIFTYLVNDMRTPGSQSGSTPYSFVSAAGPPIVPGDMQVDEIAVNDWLARDLGLSRGDGLQLTYYLLGRGGELRETSSNFTVREILSIEGPAGDPGLMPDFPGIAEVESSFDWSPGIPIDLDRIRDKDEEYWERYRGTPKAFVTLEAAQAIWRNRFGDLTAVRYPASDPASSDPAARREGIAAELLATLDPGAVGMRVVPVLEEGMSAGSGAVDFGQLFLALSFFLLAAAVLLTALLYSLGIEQRSEEAGLLRALGFSRPAIRRLRLAEGAIVALSGSILGTGLGVLYNLALLRGLNTLWRDAVGVSSIELFIRPSTLVAGALAGLIIAVLTMWVAATGQLARQPAELQRSGESGQPRSRRFRLPILPAAAAAGAAAVVLVATGITAAGNPVARFFIAGGLALASLLLLGYSLLQRLRRSLSDTAISVPQIGLRGLARRPARSLAVAGLTAFGIFIVIAVGANRLDPFVAAGDRSAGTGGFALYGETTVPVAGDLNQPADRIRAGLAGDSLHDARFVQLRVQEGDDASCLNLNQVRNPRILGIEPEAFAERGAFSFVENPGLRPGQSPWQLLKERSDPDVIPAIVDQTVLTWGLHKEVGDTLSYTDELGREFELRIVASLANSVFQGSVLISERRFLERFPSESGTRVFLVDAPPSDTEALSQEIRRGLRDYGLELQPAVERLAQFNKVQNTYLSIFLLLGGLGLVLGSLGMGLIVARNTSERRGELALLRAVGYGRKLVRRILLDEHLFLLGYGLATGIVAALAAVLPVMVHRGEQLPLAFLGLLVAAVAGNGLFWTYLSVASTTRGQILPALRSE